MLPMTITAVIYLSMSFGVKMARRVNSVSIIYIRWEQYPTSEFIPGRHV